MHIAKVLPFPLAGGLYPEIVNVVNGFKVETIAKQVPQPPPILLSVIIVSFCINGLRVYSDLNLTQTHLTLVYS